jgi:amidase
VAPATLGADPASSVRPASYLALAGRRPAQGQALWRAAHVHQRRRTKPAPAKPGIGGPTGQRIHTRASVIDLWKQARQALEAAGAEVIEVDFPLVSNCEGDRPGAPTVFNRGIVSKEFLHDELWELSGWAFDDFLRANGDPSSTAWPMSMARRSSRTTRAPCPTARTTWPPAWTSTSTWPSAA